MELDGRTVSDGYRFGYQGFEKDKEFKGDGNSYTTEFRQLDPRLGRWLSVDPMYAKFPWQSPYCAMDDNPCFLNDYYGMESQPVDGGCNKYSGAGNTTLILPEKAKILSKLIDYENDGKINYKGIVYEGKDGDIKEFSINGVKYSVRWGSDGTYKGYFNDKGERYINPKSESKSQKSQVPLGTIKNGPPKHPEFKSPKGGNRKVKNPNGSGTGWIDNNGDVWVATDHNGTHAPHWDKQSPGGKHTNVYLNEEDYEADDENPSSQSSSTFTPSTIQVATGVTIVVVSYEIIKWGAAIMLAPITSGASLGAAALTP